MIKQQLHIALVEDEINIAENYRDALQRIGYRVSIFHNRQDALAAFALALPDMAIIDVGLQDEYEGGFELCRTLRQLSDTLPIIFLTARNSELDEISALRLGADDYLTKDVSIHQVLARVSALFRRVQALKKPVSNDEQVLNRGLLRINVERIETYWQEQPVMLTLTEFWIVHTLAKYPGQVKNRDQLMDAAHVVLDNNTITTHIKRIRKKFSYIDSEFNAIKTAYGMGYRWVIE
ncbi:proteobacterial dedicated sortase system response regulator [Moritella marina ATCC 15381]|uniref:Proteobacterial dedicated sortase system response regulator n=1 Tax=Moritella marina ATCC 15381 TaxID=1202962 RepID=A0A5J6WGW9_MORMI|nr:proteobacterial dedicated sortase system response regulator [Moritella marina]QFI37227.1 proteobacterial dedicated sortase system response regulator [Moritella marina ATCC 15381]